MFGVSHSVAAKLFANSPYVVDPWGDFVVCAAGLLPELGESYECGMRGFGDPFGLTRLLRKRDHALSRQTREIRGLMGVTMGY